ERAEGLLGGKFLFKSKNDGTTDKTKVVCSICQAEFSYHRSRSSLSYHLNAKHPTESSPRLDGRQPTLHDFTKITRPVREKVIEIEIFCIGSKKKKKHSRHTAEDCAEEFIDVSNRWEISGKLTTLGTDSARIMLAAARLPPF